MTPILYTFRRCPYAIRARMALAYANIEVESCEVDLKNKPDGLLMVSSKATVPVLVFDNGRVLDESLDIMEWALEQADPRNWSCLERKSVWKALIYEYDTSFKSILDNYKYPQKSEKKNREFYRNEAKLYLEKLNSLLKQNHYLITDHITIADIAIFPFIRQFYLVDIEWFNANDYTFLQRWLDYFLTSTLFARVMTKNR